MPEPHILFLDFESFYSDTYSLRKMPTPNYILGPEFETIMCAVAVDNEPSEIVDGPDFGNFISRFDPAVTTTVTFNALFDNSILAWVYGFVPRLMLDSMGMARALLGHELSAFNLGAVSEHLGGAGKLGALVKVKGMHRQQIMNAGLWGEFSTYALDDNEKSRNIFKALIPRFPHSERRIMDLVIRATVQPEFILDTAMLRQHILNVQKDKDDLLLEIGMRDDAHFFLTPERKEELVRTLQSAPKFQAELERLGVTVTHKLSPAGKSIPAFAKTDAFMEELSEHDDPRVQALAAARVGHKSTLEETRSEKLLSIAEQPWSCYRDGSPRLYSGGTMPIPLRYGAAHTHRLGGEWGMNMQNMPTVRGSKGKSRLRQSLLAPPGHKVIVADLGQIEARLAAWLCGCSLLVKQFADKLDPYNALGTRIFGFPVNRKVHIPEGFIGKTGILGLGYGCGVDHFHEMVVKMARAMGVDISKIWGKSVAATAVKAYREMYHEIPSGWARLDYILKNAWLGQSGPMCFGPNNVVRIEKGRVALPSGLFLEYGNPRYDDTDGKGELWYTFGRFQHKLYGAKFLENIDQALARIVVMNAALRIADRGYRFKLQAHDELVFIVADNDVDKAKLIIHEEMTRSPSWAPNLPLTADVGVGASYGEAK